MDDADIFHTAVAGYGGRLDTASLPPEHAASLNYVAERARRFLQEAETALPEMPPIHFDFINNWKFNAVAFRQDERYFIGVYRGTVATLGVLFDRMFADPRVLPFLGNVEEEVADLPLLPNIGLDFRRSVDSVPPFPRPRSPARREMALRLGELALDFLTAHEFGHIANGHLDYLQANQGSLGIDEASGARWAPMNSESALINQTMEMDADGVAVQLTLSSEWGRVTWVYPRRSPAWDYIYNRPGYVALMWSWAVSSLFRLFGKARLPEEDKTLESYYPHPRLRSVMAQRAAQRIPRPQGLDTHPAFLGDEPHKIPAIRAGQLDVEKIFSILTGQPVAMEGLDDAWGDVGRAQIHRLQDYWQTKLKEELLEFAYQPLINYGDSGEEATGEGS